MHPATAFPQARRARPEAPRTPSGWRSFPQLLERSRGGLTFEELARELGCTARTVMRDLILSLKVADTAEIKGWILGFGQEAEVLEPASLREQIRAEAEALLGRLEVSDALREISSEQLTLP